MAKFAFSSMMTISPRSSSSFAITIKHEQKETQCVFIQRHREKQDEIWWSEINLKLARVIYCFTKMTTKVLFLFQKRTNK